MTDQYGEFGKCITSLDNAQECVRTVWHDEVANSYDNLNDNIKLCAQKIWYLFCDSNGGVEAVKKHYNSDNQEKEIAMLGMQIEQV